MLFTTTAAGVKKKKKRQIANNNMQQRHPKNQLIVQVARRHIVVEYGMAPASVANILFETTTARSA